MSENSSCDTDDVSDYGVEIPPEIVEAAKEVSLNSLPGKSERLYVSTYNNISIHFMYAFLFKTKTLFPYFVELRGTIALKNNIRHTYFVEPRGTRDLAAF